MVLMIACVRDNLSVWCTSEGVDRVVNRSIIYSNYCTFFLAMQHTVAHKHICIQYLYKIV